MRKIVTMTGHALAAVSFLAVAVPAAADTQAPIAAAASPSPEDLRALADAVLAESYAADGPGAALLPGAPGNRHQIHCLTLPDRSQHLQGPLGRSQQAMLVVEHHQQVHIAVRPRLVARIAAEQAHVDDALLFQPGLKLTQLFQQFGAGHGRIIVYPRRKMNSWSRQAPTG